MDAETIIDQIIRREGGFVNHPADRGGPTKYGITQATLSRWRRGEPVSPSDVEALTEDEARRIYRTLYITRPGFHMIEHAPLRALVVDCGVHHGVRRAAEWLQEAAGAPVDGIVGPVTLKAVNGGDGHKLYRKVLATRAGFYGWIIARDHAQAVFAKGWMKRLAEFIENCP